MDFIIVLVLIDFRVTTISCVSLNIKTELGVDSAGADCPVVGVTHTSFDTVGNFMVDGVEGFLVVSHAHEREIEFN